MKTRLSGKCVLTVGLEECCRRLAGERPKLVDHVRLVVEAQLRRCYAPLFDIGGQQQVHQRLEATEAREVLRGQPRGDAEAACQRLVAHAVCRCEVVNWAGSDIGERQRPRPGAIDIGEAVVAREIRHNVHLSRVSQHLGIGGKRDDRAARELW
jgi:hypothetical protein